MDLVLANVFMLTVFAKTLGSVSIFGLNFAPWDLFLLYPLVQRKLFYRYHIQRIHVALYFFIASLLLSTLFNFSESYAFIGLALQIIRNVFILDLFYRIGTRFYEKSYIKTFTIWGISVPLFHLLAYYSPLQQMISEPSIGNFMRLEGFVGDSNFFAFSILLLGLSATKYRTFILFMILPCILLSGSRSGLGIWFVLFYLFFRNYRLYLFTGFAITIFYFKDVILTNIAKYDNLFNLFSRSIYDFSRLRYWIEAIDKFDDQFLFGNGPKSFVYDIGNFSHNDFITSYYEYGVFGIITFTLLIFSLLRLHFNSRFGSNLDLQIAYFSVILILNLFSFWLFPHIWILQGVLIGIFYANSTKSSIQLAHESSFSGLTNGKRTVN